MLSQKIGKIEAIALVLVVVINSVIFNIPNIMINSVGSGVILNVIFISIIAIIFTYVICKLFKPFGSKDILDISEYIGGKSLKIFIGIAFILFLIITACLNISYLANELKIIYFNSTPIIFLMLLLLIPALFGTKTGLKAISGVNFVFIFIVIFSLILLFVSSYDNFTIERIFPLLGNGFSKTFLVGSTNIFAFSGIIFLYFIPSMLKDSKDFKIVSIYSTILSSILLFASVLLLLMSFPTIVFNDEIHSIYFLTRIVELGDFLERLDAIFIFIWIMVLITFLSFTFFTILYIFKKISKIENSNTLIPSVGFIALGSALIIKNFSVLEFFIKYIYKYSILILCFFICFTVLILGYIKNKKSKNKLGNF